MYKRQTLNWSTHSVLPTAPINSAPLVLDEHTLPLLEKQMREVENGIENMLNAIQAGVLTNSTKSRLEKLEAQQKELEVRIAEEKIARPRLSENQRCV